MAIESKMTTTVLVVCIPIQTVLTKKPTCPTRSLEKDVLASAAVVVVVTTTVVFVVVVTLAQFALSPGPF